MGQNSKIEWCDHTVNLWWGCAKVHTGCKNCYAEFLSDTRYNNDLWGEKAGRRRIKSAFKVLWKVQCEAEVAGVRTRVFIGSMMDLFEAGKDLINPSGNWLTTHNMRMDLFREIDAGLYPNIIFLFLTKRPELIPWAIPSSWKETPPSNVWFGTSLSDQETADNIIYHMRFDGNKFLSVEPQVGSIDNIDLSGIKWVIQGGESGPRKRPFDIEWAHKMRNICADQKVPYFFKQIDKVQEIPAELMIRQIPKEFKSKIIQQQSKIV